MARRTARASISLLAALVILAGLAAGPALACAGLVGKGGTVRLLRTATLAAYVDGQEHYLTSFSFAGGGAKFGSVIPLPGVPTDVRKGGEWALQRLARETQPVEQFAGTSLKAAASADSVEVLRHTRIDALDVTIVRGGGAAVGAWARKQGFDLSVDAPEVLDFYAARSRVFMAASFDARAAAKRGQQLGDGTPIQLTIPTANPWVPLRILGLGHRPGERIDADVYLLTERRPALLPRPVAPGHAGVSLEQSRPASSLLLDDLRRDENMGWMPASGMHLSYLRVDTTAGALTYDLAIDASGRHTPSPVAAGLVAPGETYVAPRPLAARVASLWPWLVVALAAGGGLILAVGSLQRAGRRAGTPR
ncbi:MAG TPA: DUF2330 domain-containing protein [Actinomycetes bacterium]